MNGENESDSIIEISELSKVFKVGFWGRKVNAVQGLNLEVRSNEIFGFLGPNGAGKTTTIKMILNLIYQTKGEIKIFGKPNTDVGLRKRIGFLPENPYFYDYLKAREFLNFYGQLMDLSRSERNAKTGELLKMVGLENVDNIQLRRFSKGMVQRLGLAQALINDPDLVILDEPMSGLDPVGRKEMRDIILDMKRQGKTVFFSTHILPDVEMVCDRVAIIHDGKMRAIGALSDILGPTVKNVDVTVGGIDDESRLSEFAERIIRSGNIVHLSLERPELLDKLIRCVLEMGGGIIEVFPRRQSLETYFLEKVGENDNGTEDSI